MKKRDCSNVTMQIGYSALVDLRRLVSRGVSCIQYHQKDEYHISLPESLPVINQLLTSAMNEMRLIKAKKRIENTKEGA